MSSLNKVILIGRLCADPETRLTQTGIPVTNFRLAVDRDFGEKGAEKATDFIPIVTWRKLADLCAQYCQKGMMVAVDGRLQMRTYQTQQGDQRTVAEVVADTVKFLTPKSQQQQSGAAPNPPEEDAPPADESNVPF